MSTGSIPADDLGSAEHRRTKSDGVPVIDGSDLCKSYEDGSLASKSIVGQIREACTRWGFFQLVNHGIPSDVLRYLQDETTRYLGRREA